LLDYESKRNVQH